MSDSGRQNTSKHNNAERNHRLIERTEHRDRQVSARCREREILYI